MNDVEQVKGKIASAMAVAKAKGWRLVRKQLRGPFNAVPCACAIGCVVIDLPYGQPFYSVAAERLGIGIGEVIAIARGFDGSDYDHTLSTPDWHHLGERIYSEMKEGTL